MKAPADTHLFRGGMADALASGASVRKDVGVQVSLRIPVFLKMYNQ